MPFTIPAEYDIISPALLEAAMRGARQRYQDDQTLALGKLMLERQDQQDRSAYYRDKLDYENRQLEQSGQMRGIHNYGNFVAKFDPITGRQLWQSQIGPTPEPARPELHWEPFGTYKQRADRYGNLYGERVAIEQFPDSKERPDPSDVEAKQLAQQLDWLRENGAITRDMLGNPTVANTREGRLYSMTQQRLSDLLARKQNQLAGTPNASLSTQFYDFQPPAFGPANVNLLPNNTFSVTNPRTYQPPPSAKIMQFPGSNTWTMPQTSAVPTLDPNDVTLVLGQLMAQASRTNHPVYRQTNAGTKYSLQPF
jgi:hypothetical protein